MTHPAASAQRHDVPTSQGPAQVRVLAPGHDGQPGSPGPTASTRATGGRTGAPRGTLLLGHGAGGSRDAADVLALTDLTELGWTVVLVDQPWRVAGKKVASRPPVLDLCFAELTEVLTDEKWQRERGLSLPRPWVHGGRSAGARVACRAAVTVDGDTSHGGARPVAAVVCLAFPLHPPGKPESSRAHELGGPVQAGIPTLVVQGTRDPFGSPEEVCAAVQGEALTVHAVSGTHSPARDLETVRAHVATFLDGLGR